MNIKMISLVIMLLSVGVVNNFAFADGIYSISGKVYDRLTNNPIEGAVIKIIGTGHRVTSELDGSFSIKVPKPGRYSVSISTNIDGLETVEKKVYIGNNTSYDFSVPDDISAYPITNVPRPVEKLAIKYPTNAQKLDVEAKVKMKLLITDTGLVKRIKIEEIILSKELPDNDQRSMRRSFTRAVQDLLLGAQFTPCVINRKKTPVIINFNLNFSLKKKDDTINTIVLKKGE